MEGPPFCQFKKQQFPNQLGCGKNDEDEVNGASRIKHFKTAEYYI